MYCRNAATRDSLTENAAYPSCQPNFRIFNRSSLTHFDEFALMTLSISEMHTVGLNFVKRCTWSGIPPISSSVPPSARTNTAEIRIEVGLQLFTNQRNAPFRA